MRWGSRSISPHILLNDLLTLRVTGVVVVTAVRDESGVRDVVVMLVATYFEWHLARFGCDGVGKNLRELVRPVVQQRSK